MTDHRARAKEAWAKLGEVLKAAKRVHPHDNKAMALFVDEAATNQLTAICREVERETWEKAAKIAEDWGEVSVAQAIRAQAAQGKEEG